MNSASRRMKLRQAYVLLVASLVLAINNGLTFAGITVFDNDLLQLLEVSVAQLKFRDTLHYLVAAAIAPAIGVLVDRHGARPALLIGTLLIIFGFVAYGLVTSLRQIYGLHIFLFGPALATGGLMVSVILVSQWFGAWRGRALGILVSGSSIGNALVPQLNAELIGALGWREAFMWSALLPAILLPLLWLLPRCLPNQAGADEPGDTPDIPEGREIPYAQALRTPQFWLLGLIAFITFYALMGMTSNIVLHMQRDLTQSLNQAANSVSILFLAAIVTKIGGGWLADRHGPGPVLVGCLGLMMMGSAMLCLMTVPTAMAGVLILGLGWGSLYTMVHLLPSKLFGLNSLGKIMGTLIIFETLGGASGPFGVGMFYDLYGSYQWSFIIVTFMLFAALLAALKLNMIIHRGRIS